MKFKKTEKVGEGGVSISQEGWGREVGGGIPSVEMKNTNMSISFS